MQATYITNISLYYSRCFASDRFFGGSYKGWNGLVSLSATFDVTTQDCLYKRLRKLGTFLLSVLKWQYPCWQATWNGKWKNRHLSMNTCPSSDRKQDILTWPFEENMFISLSTALKNMTRKHRVSHLVQIQFYVLNSYIFTLYL